MEAALRSNPSKRKAKVMYSPIHEAYICIYLNRDVNNWTIQPFNSKKEAEDFRDLQERPILAWYMKED